jgi:predicted N-acetyltransferase YhbS
MVKPADLARPADRLPTPVAEQPKDGAAVADLIARAFGPGRYAKTAERLREANHPRLDLSFVAYDGNRLAGCVRLWPITIAGQALVFLGPFAVDPALRSQGLGAALIERACLAAAEAGEKAILLVGDLAYFSRMGFERTDPTQIQMPGPVDTRRVLIRRLSGEALAYAGRVRAV